MKRTIVTLGLVAMMTAVAAPAFAKGGGGGRGGGGGHRSASVHFHGGGGHKHHHHHHRFHRHLYVAPVVYGSCSYYYSKWKHTGSLFWKAKYYDCIS